MAETVSTYKGAKVEIMYDRRLCIHAAECGRGSQALFDESKDPWCDPDAVDADKAVAVVARCPTGALTARILDDAVAAPATATAVTVTVNPDGPLYVEGPVSLNGVAAGPRVALCRCGASTHKPRCDRAHVKSGFKDSGPVGADPAHAEIEDGPVNVTCVKDGPYVFEGPMTLRAGSGRVAFRGHRAALCRCGGSRNKPFCDGSHKTNGFTSE